LIDLHMHVLPGVDDGPDQTREAVAMCRAAAAAGCETLVATPHQRHASWENTDAARLAARLEELKEAVGPSPKLLLGAEIRIDSRLLEDLDSLPASGVLPLAGTRYLLLEADRELPGPEPRDLVHELALRGWRPIFAHPEFIPSLYGNLDLVSDLVAAGALMQVTAGSLLGKFGRRSQRIAEQLLDGGQVHVIASDAHGIHWRPPDLGEAHAAVASRWGEEAAWRLCVGHPRAIIQDRPLAEGIV
jgi:protein-tyrosine phosphatase